MVVQTRTDLAGIDLEKGKVLWKKPIEAYRGMNILTPAIAGDSVFTSSHGGKSLLFEVEKKNDGFAVAAQKWENIQEAYMSSPILIGDFCYLHLRKQRMACLNLKTGETAWISSESFGKYMSMVSNGKDILALDEDGTLYLIGANSGTTFDQAEANHFPSPDLGPFGHFRKPTLRPRTRSHRLLRVVSGSKPHFPLLPTAVDRSNGEKCPSVSSTICFFPGKVRSDGRFMPLRALSFSGQVELGQALFPFCNEVRYPTPFFYLLPEISSETVRTDLIPSVLWPRPLPFIYLGLVLTVKRLRSLGGHYSSILFSFLCQSPVLFPAFHAALYPLLLE